VLPTKELYRKIGLKSKAFIECKPLTILKNSA
jgi:hypothetical protein